MTALLASFFLVFSLSLLLPGSLAWKPLQWSHLLALIQAAALAGTVALGTWQVLIRLKGRTWTSLFRSTMSLSDSRRIAALSIDRKGRITWCNLGFESLTGLKASQVKGSGLTCLFHSAGGLSEGAWLLAAVQKRCPVQGEAAIRRSNGIPLTGHVTFEPLSGRRSKGGTILFTDISSPSRQDITSRRSALADQALASARVTPWETTSPGMDWLITGGLAHLLPSPAALFIGPDQAELSARVDSAWGTGDPFHMEGPSLLKDGSPAWLRVTGQAEVRSGRVARLWGLVEDITELREARQEAVLARRKDLLTGAASLVPFRELLEVEAGPASPHRWVGLIMVHLCGLKELNHKHGYDAGDDLLRQTAQILDRLMGEFAAESHVKDAVHLSRIGGGRFGIALLGLAGPTSLEACTKSVATALAEMIKGTHEHIRVTVGSSEAEAPMQSLDTLWQAAERAVERAKSAPGRLSHSLHIGGEQEAKGRIPEILLDRALSGNDLCLRYEPVFSLDQKKLERMEAHLRWSHPHNASNSGKSYSDEGLVRGHLNPQDFLSQDCGSSAVATLGAWLLEGICHQLEEWDARWPSVRVKQVAFRLDPRHLSDGDFCRGLYRILAGHPSASGRLAFLLPQEALLTFGAASFKGLEAARAAGVRVMMDASGPDLPRESHLRTLPLDGIRLGRSFLVEGSGAGLLGGQRGGGLLERRTWDISARGIETGKDLGRFLRLGCRYGQGSRLGSPLTPEEAGRLVAASALSSETGRSGWVA